MSTTPKETQHPSYSETTSTNAILAINTTSRERYLLPYFHFLSGQYRQDHNTGQHVLILEFALHTVRIEGVNLKPLASAIQNMQVKVIKLASPEAQKTNAVSKADSEPLVTRVDVVYNAK